MSYYISLDSIGQERCRVTVRLPPDPNSIIVIPRRITTIEIDQIIVRAPPHEQTSVPHPLPPHNFRVGNVFGVGGDLTYVYGPETRIFINTLHQHAATGAFHDSYERHPFPSCYPNTRKEVFQHIADSDKPIVVIHSPSGQGKSAISQTLAERYNQKGILAATFFFDKTSPQRNNPSQFVATLATQLALYIPGLNSRIGDAVGHHPKILDTNLEQQLDKLIIEPFRDFLEEQSQQAAGADSEQANSWIILDGLDECIAPTPNRKEPTELESKKAQLRILELVHKLRSTGLPLSFLISTRPETSIMNHCKQFSNFIKVIDICALDGHRQDVETVLKVGLRTAARERRRTRDSGDIGEVDREKLTGERGDTSKESGDEDWPGELRVRRLVEMTRGNMLSATNVIRQIKDFDGDLEHELDRLLGLEKGLRPDPPPEPLTVSANASAGPSFAGGHLSGANISGGVQLGCTTNNNSFHQTFQANSNPQFTYTFDFGGRQVRLRGD